MFSIGKTLVNILFNTTNLYLHTKIGIIIINIYNRLSTLNITLSVIDF